MPSNHTSKAYDVARLVFSGEVLAAKGAALLVSEYGFNEASASYIIRVYRNLRRGEVFKRALSAPDMDTFLTCIGSDSGPQALRIAVHSLWLHLNYYEAKRQTRMSKLRGIAAKHQALAETDEQVEATEASFLKAVQRSMADSSTERNKRLALAPKIPERKVHTAIAFARNPDVVAAVLLRANGQCERCSSPAPFIRRKDNTPYLEVHHIKLLADDGEDSVDNSTALCPNCHRELHFGGNAF